MIRYCPTCGEEVREGAKFCHNCGVALTDDFKDTHVYDLFETKEKKEEAPKAQDNDVTRTLGILIIIAMLAGVVLTFTDIFAAFGFSNLSYVSNYLSSLDEPWLRLLAGLVPLVWRIPLAIISMKVVKSKKKFDVGFGVVSLLFCNIIAGILMFIYNPEGKQNIKK